MFDWFRKHDETETEQVASPEHTPGNPLSALESLSNGQTLPEVAPGAATAVHGAAASMAEAGDAGGHGPSEQADDAATGEEESRDLGPVGPPLDGSLGDESAGPIGSEAARTPPPLSGRGAGRRPGRRLVKSEEVERPPLTGEQRLWILDTWKRSGLPAGDFAPLVGVSKHTLYSWKKQFAEHGPAGLMQQKRGVREGSRLPELTKRTILLLK